MISRATYKFKNNDYFWERVNNTNDFIQLVFLKNWKINAYQLNNNTINNNMMNQPVFNEFSYELQYLLWNNCMLVREFCLAPLLLVEFQKSKSAIIQLQNIETKSRSGIINYSAINITPT
ncbi:hypothetical protein AYI70_g7747 [Smittium culicis]|uniref:Uncharacterized protein n=1 Tax=Smittium culicis TaxID=133412 RepID=A0A1R1XJ59_9FUNG|nr:hypothetical protein AYI70_g7747 [Smittium culicis]